METIAEKASCLFSSRFDRREEDGRITSDITIVAGKYPDIKQFPVDSFILNIASPKFENLVSTRNNGEIRILDFHPSVVEKVLRYLYTDRFEADGAEKAMDIFLAAEYFQLPHLQSLCNKYLDGYSVTSCEASKLFEIAYKHGFPNILSKSAESLFKKTNEFLKDGGLSNASKNIIEKLAKHAFCVEEALLVSKILDWCANECITNTAQDSNADKHKILETILPHMLFLCLSNTEFANIVIPSNILTMEEITAICSNKNASKNKKLSMPHNLSSKLKREQQYISLNFHSETSTPERILSDNDTFSVKFWIEKDCFIEGMALPVIFYPNYQFTMSFQITLTDLISTIKYHIPSPVECDVQCQNNIAAFQLPSSLYIKKQTPMKLKVKYIMTPTSLHPVIINKLLKSEQQNTKFILKTSKRTGKYEWYGKPIAYIHDTELNGFQISGLLLMF